MATSARSGDPPARCCWLSLHQDADRAGVAPNFPEEWRGGARYTIGPSDFAYQFLPASWGQDSTRRTIRVEHLLTMSSGLEPDDNPPSPSAGTSAYEQKLLAPAVRSQPGLEWSYASLPVDVLSLVAENVTGTKLGTFWQQEIGSKIGVASLTWGALGTHTYASAMLRPQRAILPGSHTSCFSRASGTGPRS